MALTRPRYGQLDTSVIATSDPITILNQGSSSANVDVGFLFNRASGLVPNVALYWSESAQSIVTAYTNNNGISAGNITVSSYANLTVGNVLLVEGGILGVSGNIEGNTSGIHYGSVVASSITWSNGTPIFSTINSIVEAANTSLKSYTDSQISTVSSAIVTANTALKGYVDNQITTLVGGAPAALDTLYEISNSLGNNASLSTTLLNSIAGANAAIVTANSAMKLYVDTQDSAITTAWQSNASTQLSQIIGANAAIVTANTAMKSYVDSTIATANTAMKSYVDSSIATIDLSGYATISQVTGANAAIVTANTAMKSYVDAQDSAITAAWQANASTQLSQIIGANAAIVTANTAMKSYVDSANSIQSSQIATLQGQVYTNSNVNAYLTSSGAGNITINNGAFNLTEFGPGATTVGSATAIPVITTDAYGRVASLSTASVSSTLNTSGTTGTGTVALTSQSLTFAGTYGVTASASNQTITIATPQDLRTTASPVFASATYTGNVEVQGTLTVANLQARGSMDIVAQDPMLYLQANILYPWDYDTGIFSDSIGGPANAYVHHGVVRSYLNNYWGFFSNVHAEPAATVDWAATDLIWDTIKSGDHIIANSTSSTSTTTGALRVSGGAGIAGAVYAGSVYDSGNRVVSTSSGAGNLTISGAGISLTATGPGATSVGSATAIPVITVDAYGRVTALSTASVSSTLNIAGSSGTGSVALTSQSLSIAGGTGITTSASGQTITVTNSGVTGLSSSGTGNLTVSASTGSVTVSLPATGPGSASVGSSTAIPVITTDAYGRVSSTSTAAVVAPAGTLTGSTLASGVTASSLTSVGTITSGTWSGSFGAVSGANLTNLTAGNLSGTIPSAVLGNSTLYIGTTAVALNRASSSISLTGVNIDGSAGSATTATNLSGGSVSATTGSFSGATTRNSKALITNYTGTTAPTSPQQGDEWYNSTNGVLYKYIYDGTSNNWINISSALTNSSTSATANTLALRDSGGNLTATNFLGTASSAKYADLAEIYTSDKNYEPGSVVVFGGTAEITSTKKTHDTRVAGVISTNPAYLMNSEAEGLPVAFTGRVPCKVRGPVSKGDVLVTSAYPEYAERMTDTLYRPGCVLGKSLGEVEANVFATIEVVVGRF